MTEVPAAGPASEPAAVIAAAVTAWTALHRAAVRLAGMPHPGAPLPAAAVVAGCLEDTARSLGDVLRSEAAAVGALLQPPLAAAAACAHFELAVPLADSAAGRLGAASHKVLALAQAAGGENDPGPGLQAIVLAGSAAGRMHDFAAAVGATGQPCRAGTPALYRGHRDIIAALWEAAERISGMCAALAGAVPPAAARIPAALDAAAQLRQAAYDMTDIQHALRGADSTFARALSEAIEAGRPS